MIPNYVSYKEQLTYLRELEERRDVILKNITEQDKLTPELEKIDTRSG